MRKEQKDLLVNDLTAKISEYNHFYIADAGDLNASVTSELRRICFKQDVKMIMVKNNIFIKALDKSEGQYEELYGTLKGSSAVFFSNTGNVPAKLIKEFSKANKKPLLKSAYVEECVYVGENILDTLCSIKSKEEVIGDVIALLQSPAKNVISALQSGGSTLHGLLKTLGERE